MMFSWMVLGSRCFKTFSTAAAHPVFQVVVRWDIGAELSEDGRGFLLTGTLTEQTV